MKEYFERIAETAANRPRGMTTQDQLNKIAQIASEALAIVTATPDGAAYGSPTTVDPWTTLKIGDLLDVERLCDFGPEYFTDVISNANYASTVVAARHAKLVARKEMP